LGKAPGRKGDGGVSTDVACRTDTRWLHDVAFLLLLLQAGMALLTAIGGVVLQVVAPGFRGVLVTAGIEFGIAILLLVLAAGVLRSRTWASRWTVGLETVVLMGTVLTAITQFGVSRTLAFVVAQVMIPALVLLLVLWSGGTRPRACAPAPACADGVVDEEFSFEVASSPNSVSGYESLLSGLSLESLRQ